MQVWGFIKHSGIVNITLVSLCVSHDQKCTQLKSQLGKVRIGNENKIFCHERCYGHPCRYKVNLTHYLVQIDLECHTH